MRVDVAIIGAGPVGLFAAFQAGMLGMKSCVVDALDCIGGQCSALYPEKPIYDIPGYPNIQAAELVYNLKEQASRFDPEYLLSRQVNSLSKDGDLFRLSTSKGDVIEAKIVLIAAGAGSFGPNRPPLKGIEKYEGKSVFYLVGKREELAGKRITIAGGGDSAIDWAISLSSIAKVTLVHRRAKFRAADASVKELYRLSEEGKINLVINYQLSALEGDADHLEKIVVSDLDGNEKVIDTDILLPFFGLKQNLGPINDFGLDIEQNYLKVKQPNYETNVPGIYAVGDVAKYEGKLKLILTGFAEVSSALHHSYSRVFDGKALHFEYSTSKIN
ncbi:MAG: hypothetical protein DGJ47_000573 [Rickettsiaceae bacterium]